MLCWKKESPTLHNFHGCPDLMKNHPHIALIMDIAVYLYKLYFRDNYSTVGQGSFREGALLRIAFEDEVIGYSDCHPWVELGDAPLSKQLIALAQAKLTPLLCSSMHFARLDGEARRDGRSLFEGINIPPSHRLISLSEDLKGMLNEGITRFKLKTGGMPIKEISAMVLWVDQFPGIRLRLDFNERLARSAFLNYWKNLPLQVQHSIDFVEDPYPYDPEAWCKDQAELGVAFAADRSSAKALNTPESARYIIHKPAVEKQPVLANPMTRLVVTTYLDHPLGQMCAAYSAAQLQTLYPSQVEYCGLLTHYCYHADPFIQTVQTRGPHLIPSKGTGLGFNALLQEVPWQNL